MYAIVDIETTGGHASANGITEVAVVIHDGKQVLERYQTLVNPGIEIPIYIRVLTGITNEMVSTAPAFKDVAETVYNLIHDKIFVAHNVNFDYSFLKYHFASAGFNLQSKKLCTVRLGRKIFPGLPSYSLGKFARHMGVEIIDRHRAAGDAEATSILFAMMLENDGEGHISDSLNQRSKEQSLPPHLPKEQVEKLPSGPGVYYFHTSKGKVIYVGKAKNLRKRVCSHFANNSPRSQKQEFLRNIYSVTYQSCGTELMAFILEAVEIKRLWPAYNRSLKRFEHAWGLYAFEDQKGYLRLAIDKRSKYSIPLYTFNAVLEGHGLLRTLIKEFKLCPKLCFVQRNNDPCNGSGDHVCRGACTGEEPYQDYNEHVHRAIQYLKEALPTYAILDEGRSVGEHSCILMEDGQFYGMGYLNKDISSDNLPTLKSALTAYPANDYIKNLIHQFASRHPAKTISF